MDWIGLLTAFTEKSLVISIVILLAGCVGFIRAAIDIVMAVNTRFNDLTSLIQTRNAETKSTMAGEITRLHIHLSSVERFLSLVAFALMETVPNKEFKEKVGEAIQKMQDRDEP